MTLPGSRDITLASGTQIPSTLLNNLQDMIIGSKHPTRIIQLNKGLGFGVGAFRETPETIISPAAASPLSAGFSIPLHIGDRILSMDFWATDGAGGSETLQVAFGEIDHATAVLTFPKNGVSTTSNNSGTTQKLNVNMVGNEITIASGKSYFARATPGTSFVFSLIAVEVSYDRL
jgi:hypothetical protein